jgi:hypothetical protein
MVKFANGSVGNLTYLANGDKSLPKENIEVLVPIRWESLRILGRGVLHKNNTTKKLSSEGKGHKEEVSQFLEQIKEGKDAPIDFRSICLTTLVSLKVKDSLSTGLPQEVKL